LFKDAVNTNLLPLYSVNYTENSIDNILDQPSIRNPKDELFLLAESEEQSDNKIYLVGGSSSNRDTTFSNTEVKHFTGKKS